MFSESKSSLICIAALFLLRVWSDISIWSSGRVAIDFLFAFYLALGGAFLDWSCILGESDYLAVLGIVFYSFFFADLAGVLEAALLGVLETGFWLELLLVARDEIYFLGKVLF